MSSTLNLAVLVLAFALTPFPLGCQRARHVEHTVHVSGEETRMRWVQDDRTVEIRTRGEIELDEAEASVRSISPGGRLTLMERTGGGAERRAELHPTGGGITRAYRVDGRERPWNEEASRWLASILPEIARESGVDAQERVERIRRGGGATAVLEEIGRIRGDGSKAAHLRALASVPLTEGEAVVALRHAGTIGSDSHRAEVLLALADRGVLARAAVQRAFFSAVEGLGSDARRRSVLETVLRQDGSEAVRMRLLRSARSIGSDAHRAALLVDVAERGALSGPALISAYFDAVGGIGSDSQRGRVLTTVLGSHGERPEVVLAVLRSARSIGSDSVKAAVLLAVSRALLDRRDVAEVYREASGSIGSERQRSRVEAHAVERGS